jgi:hypothetical protein
MSIDLRAFSIVVVLLIATFASSVGLREPWRGYLAKGDQFVTAQTLRWVRTWQRDGDWQSKFAIVTSPPTKEYEGPRRQLKWGLPGHMLLVHGILSVWGVEADVESLMRLNLAIHLTLAVLLAFVAFLLASSAWPERSHWPVVLALHCGVFSLLFPPILYWGQNLSCQYSSMLPLFVFCVAGRWLRSFFSSRGTRLAVDLAVAMCVFWGTVTEFLFWLLVPYLLLVRFLRGRDGRSWTRDPLLRTIALPFALAMVCLMLIFAGTNQLWMMQSRFAYWMVLAGPYGFNPPLALVTKVLGFFVFFVKHFWGAFGLLGLLCLVVAGLRLVRQRPVRGLSVEGREVLLDLLLPCLVLVFALGPHQAHHTTAAIKFTPFVALMWTVVIPLILVAGRETWRRVSRAAYVLLSVAVLLPPTSGYQNFFPVPEIDWEREGAFLRQHSLPSDVLFSPAMEILLWPAQRISLAERVVTHVYGPVDILRELRHMDDGRMIAIYGPHEQLHKLLVGEVVPMVEHGAFSLARLPVARFRSFMEGRPDALYRSRISEILQGGWRTDDADLSPHEGPVPVLSYPVAMHAIWVLRDPATRRYTDNNGIERFARTLAEKRLEDRLYWEDERHFHWISPPRELVMLGDDRYKRGRVGNWERVDAGGDALAEWGRFLMGLFGEAKEAGDAGEARGFSWAGHEVIRIAVGAGPAHLRDRAPSVTSWEADLLFKGSAPVAVVLEAAKDSGEGEGNRVSVLFERLVAEVKLPGYVSPQWAVRKRRAAAGGESRE